MTIRADPVGRPSDGLRPGRAPALPADERRAAIVAAATPLLRAAGRSVTTRQIADAAGIAEGTIFRVFDTKDALIAAVVEHAVDVADTVAAIRRIDPARPLAARVSDCYAILADRLRSVFEIMMALRPHGPYGADGGHSDAHPRGDGGRDRRGDLRAHHRGGPGHGPGHGPDDPRQAEILAAVAALLAPDAARLTMPPERAARLLRTLAFSGAHPMMAGREPLEPDEIADVLLHGITRPESAGAPC